MKKWISSLAIVSLLAMSSIVIYKEALARPMLCDTYEEQCGLCDGDFHLWRCKSLGDALIHCHWWCDTAPGCHWPCVWPCGTRVEGNDCVF